MAVSPNRPILRYHGGKWRLAPWIISHFPKHRIYVEPYGGAASVLLRKPRSYSEVYNDLDDEIVGLFRVLRSARGSDLVESIRSTPFARTEFQGSYEPTDDDMERARRLVIRSFMGFGSDSHNANLKTGFRHNASRTHTTPATDWRNLPASIDRIRDRLQGVVIECRPGRELIERYDSADTLFYCDPPYLPSTRYTRRPSETAYVHEMAEQDHADMLELLKALAGAVILSGYPSELYDKSLEGWTRVERAALADGARRRTEVLWLNQAAVDGQSQGLLFD